MTTLIPMTDISFAQLFTWIFSGTFGIIGLTFLAVGLGFRASQNHKARALQLFDGRHRRCISELVWLHRRSRGL